MIGSILRFKTAVALVLLGLLTLLAGIGQKTFWAPPETITATAPTGTAAPLTVFDEKLRTLHPGTVTIQVKGEGAFLVAAGRPDDVDAWVGQDGTQHRRRRLGGRQGAAADAYRRRRHRAVARGIGSLGHHRERHRRNGILLERAGRRRLVPPARVGRHQARPELHHDDFPERHLHAVGHSVHGARRPADHRRRRDAGPQAEVRQQVRQPDRQWRRRRGRQHVRPPRAGQGRGTARGTGFGRRHAGACRTRHRCTRNRCTGSLADARRRLSTRRKPRPSSAGAPFSPARCAVPASWWPC